MLKKIIITGGTGFIGENLCSQLIDANYDVIVLTRNIEKAKKSSVKMVKYIVWDGKTSTGWLDHADGAYAIINLAGENIGSGRWTKRKKQKILESRIQAGKSVVEAISRADTKPKILIQASGIGIYGDRADEILNETSTLGTGFMPVIAHQWEQSVIEAEAMGVRTVYMRAGVVLGKEAEFIKRTLLPFRLFIGGHLGSGKQWISWIHIADNVSAIRFLLEKEDLAGVFNLSSPNPLTYQDFSKNLGKVMDRPSWFHIPAFLLKILFGEMAEGLILSGQRAMPKRLQEAGFEFEYPELGSALIDVLK